MLETLIEAELGSMSGTAVEVLSERVRILPLPGETSTRAWCAVILEAHRAGISTTATLMTLLALQQSPIERGAARFQ